MEFAIVDRSTGAKPVTIRRLVAEGIPWRVRAEVWPEDGGYAGRLTFEPDTVRPVVTPRQGPTSLRGDSRTEVLAEAHAFSERRLRELLHSLV